MWPRLLFKKKWRGFWTGEQLTSFSAIWLQIRPETLPQIIYVWLSSVELSSISSSHHRPQPYHFFHSPQMVFSCVKSGMVLYGNPSQKSYKVDSNLLEQSNRMPVEITAQNYIYFAQWNDFSLFCCLWFESDLYSVLYLSYFIVATLKIPGIPDKCPWKRSWK